MRFWLGNATGVCKQAFHFMAGSVWQALLGRWQVKVQPTTPNHGAKQKEERPLKFFLDVGRVQEATRLTRQNSRSSRVPTH